MSASPREATRENSRGRRPRPGTGSRARGALVGLAAIAVALLIVAEFVALYRVVVGPVGEVTSTVTAGENHGYAVLLLALVAIPMVLGAARGARPAMAALAGLGLVVLLIALTIDLPAARETGAVRDRGLYENAQAEPAAGFFLETLGAASLLVAGGGLLMLGGRRPEPRPARRPRPRAEEG